ncbi:MAG: hypothetical protein CK429_35065 [Mycobacterium sp.]|uniref:hypothetical protein n=1 Tax=Mycobacterium sp. TaxID=1785 RepID=UPI000CB1A6F8|nr:hypothetical protein [Mycobacterium sp.]PJE01097.1 MAG: hypothetical protein CK428_31685 [Mycobacterium sp.]PJE02103.1 MAG: hypothetical protein CK429_35065 [Mycobacterium sp.]PJE21754.1 MAG: hypothetical protein CK431_20130 [Mycobacterium sp.]
MHVIAILRPRAGVEQSAFAPHVRAEEEAVWRHYAAGRLRSMRFQPDPLRVVFDFEAADTSQVTEWLAEFPMVAAGLLDAELIAAGPWMPLRALFDDAAQQL